MLIVADRFFKLFPDKMGERRNYNEAIIIQPETANRWRRNYSNIPTYKSNLYYKCLVIPW